MVLRRGLGFRVWGFVLDYHWYLEPNRDHVRGIRGTVIGF